MIFGTGRQGLRSYPFQTGSMEFIDTHTHLYDEAYGEECREAVQRALDAGVRKMIMPDIDSSTRGAMFSLAASYRDTLYPCIGLHPTSVGAGWEEEYRKVLEHKDRKDIVAVGEIGMDCYWSKDYVKEQQEVLRLQLELSLELGLPAVIHSRDATGYIFDILEGFRGRGLKGVFHAYSGSIETYSRLGQYGDWYVGIGGVVTFRNASIAETIKSIPLERILTETDSPYLTPVPFRGKRNESAYIPYIAEKIADLKGTSIAKVAETTSDNAKRLFRI